MSAAPQLWRRCSAACLLLGQLLTACQRPGTAPAPEPAPYRNAKLATAARVSDLLGRMTLPEKLGQVTQVDRQFLKAEDDIGRYFLGSVLSGGGSAPKSNTPEAWADMVDGYQKQALATRLGIPLLYGIDAVHGHNNVHGATIYPHNVGLGASRNADLVKKIGAATAEEMVATGIRWNFSPCLCVARDIRWGRTYESFGEEPEIASAMTSVISGLQGPRLDAPSAVMATAKHWIGDGLTRGGKDQGNAQVSEAELREIALPPYQEAVRRGVGSVMVSYSSWNGDKLHGSKHLITDVLKGELKFGGFVVSDWAGIKQLPGNYGAQITAAFAAGIDMVMVPDDYLAFLSALRAEVDAGRIPLSRIDDAVRRILTRKFELGLFERPLADRSLLGGVGSEAHRALARQAVQQSLVLLKNDGALLPLRKDSKRLFVAGKGADDIGMQSGGWTISWQGEAGNTTVGTTILAGIRQSVAAATTVTYDRKGAGIDGSYDAAIVVVGELPYAEGKGDRPNGMRLDQEDQATLRAVRAAGVPTVVVLLSGRPLVISEYLDNWQALVAAWLPGSEGQGVADVLFGSAKPVGKLPLSWPRSEQSLPLHRGQAGYDPLFAYGFGLTYP